MSRACIPFHILFDQELSKNELIIYGMIEHMESDHKAVFFNNRTIAEKLGVSHESRIVGKMLIKLKEKGYITREHKEISFKDNRGNITKQMRWCFNTVKSLVVSVQDDDQPGTAPLVPEVPPPLVGQVPPPLVPEVPPYNTPDLTSPLKETTTTGSGSFNPFETQCLNLKAQSDSRTPEEFLENIYHHIEHNSDKTKPYPMRRQMILSLLKNLKANGEHFTSVNFFSLEAKQETERKQKENKIEKLKNDWLKYFNSPVEIDCRSKGYESKTWQQWQEFYA